MKTHFLISLITLIAAMLMAAISSGGSGSEFTLACGSICCLGGVFSLIIAGAIRMFGRKELAKSFALAAGLSFLIGTGVCSTLLFT